MLTQKSLPPLKPEPLGFRMVLWRLNMKTVLGLLFCFIVVFTLFLGFILIVISLLSNSIGGGSIEIILENIGKVTGANGQLIVFIVGSILVALALGYSFKAFAQYAQTPKAYTKGLQKSLKTFIQLFNPL
jgi:hypothetical protein